MFNNKKAQIGETMTWVVATLVIIAILAVSIFISTAFLNKYKRPSSSYSQSADILGSESFYSYLLTNNSDGELVYGQLTTEDNLNDFNGDLGVSVFKNFYGKEYGDVWLGIIFSRTLLPAKSNDFFGNKPSSVKGGDIQWRASDYVLDTVILNENKTINLYLGEKK